MNIREIAFKVLCDVCQDGAYSNIVLDKAIRENEISAKDRGLLTNIVYGTLQNYFNLEYKVLKVCEGKTIRAKMKILLIMSLYQIEYLDTVPNYAVVNEAVEIMKNLGQRVKIKTAVKNEKWL